jgi:hypothetical protein
MSIPFHRQANNAFTTTAASISSGDTSIVVLPSILDSLALPFWADLGHEVVEVAAVDLATPTSGKTTWTVTRAVYGTAANYASGVPVAQRNYAEQGNELQDGINAVLAANLATLIQSDGVIATSAAVEECGVSPGMNLFVDIESGVIILEGAPVEVPYTQLLIVPPASGTVNQQIRVNAAGVVTAYTVAAATPAAAGYMALADLSVAYNDTTFSAGDLTDRRTFV